MSRQLEQEISVPLQVGDRVTLFTEVDMDNGGFTADTMFEDTVAQYVPETGLLRFDDSDVGRARFESMIEGSSGIQIV